MFLRGGVQTLTVNAEEYTDFYYYTVDEDGDGIDDCFRISGVKDSVINLIIPAEIDGLPIKSIKSFSMGGGSNLTSITIPDGVTLIDDFAFSKFNNLENITIPDSVESIGRGVFNGTALLENQTGPVYYADKWVVGFDNTTPNIEIKDGTRGIASCSASFDGPQLYMSCISIPDSVTLIDDDAFGFGSIYEDIILFGEYNSEAEKYAEEHNIVFNPPVITELGKYEFQLNYDSENIVYFSLPETEEYSWAFGCQKYCTMYIVGHNSISGTSNFIPNDIELWQHVNIINETGAEAVYRLRLKPIDYEYGDEKYCWSEGDSETVSLLYCKTVKEEKDLSDLAEYVVSGLTQTNIEFTIDEPVDINIDASDIPGTLPYWLEFPDGTKSSYINGNINLEEGTYTLELNPVEEDTVIHVSVVTTPTVTTSVTTTQTTVTTTTIETTKVNETTQEETTTTPIKVTTDITTPEETAVITNETTDTEETKTSDTTVSTVTTEVTTATTTTNTEQVKGDANDDGKLNIRDAAFIARKLAERKGSELPDWADYNGDGTVNIRDAAAIARYLANKPQ